MLHNVLSQKILVLVSYFITFNLVTSVKFVIINLINYLNQ